MVYYQKGSFFEKITSQFGRDHTNLLKSWMKKKIKMSTLNQQLKFLLRCRRFDVLPPHIYYLRCNITFSNNNVNHKFSKFKRRNQKVLLNLEIKDINYSLNFLRSEIKRIEDAIFLNLPRDVVSDFFRYNNDKITRHDRSMKHKLMDKFDRLTIRQNTFYNSFF